MIIQLFGGPEDGLEMNVPDEFWARGVLQLPERQPRGWAVNVDILWGEALRTHTYARRRVMPEWAGPCAMPVHIWQYQGTY